MGNDSTNKQILECPQCLEKQYAPGSGALTVRCQSCDMIVKLRKVRPKSPRMRVSIVADPSPAPPQPSPAPVDQGAVQAESSRLEQDLEKPEETDSEETHSEETHSEESVASHQESEHREPQLFAERVDVSLGGKDLLLDESAGGRLTRKKSVGSYGTSLKATEEQAADDAKGQRKRKRKSNDAESEADWGDSDGDVSRTRKGSSSKALALVAGGVLVVAVLLIAIVSTEGLRGKQSNSGSTTGADSDIAPMDYPEALRAINQFLEAQSVEELFGYIREPERVAPLAREYYERFPYEHATYGVPLALDGSEADGNFLEVNIDTNASEKRPIVVERVGNKYQVDWECWVAYSATPWDEFVGQRMTEPHVFRVFIGPDNYYNHKFQDLDYRCYQLQDQLGNHMLYGYVKPHSLVEQRLQNAFRKVQFGCAMVKLKFPEDNPGDTQGNQVDIAEFVQFGWVVRSDQL